MQKCKLYFRINNYITLLIKNGNCNIKKYVDSAHDVYKNISSEEWDKNKEKGACIVVRDYFKTLREAILSNRKRHK